MRDLQKAPFKKKKKCRNFVKIRVFKLVIQDQQTLIPRFSSSLSPFLLFHLPTVLLTCLLPALTRICANLGYFIKRLLLNRLSADSRRME